MSRNTNTPLPPANVAETLLAEVAEPIAEVARLRAEAVAADGGQREAEMALTRAKDADAEAVAEYARGRRKTEPKPTVPKARDDAEQASLHREGLRRAVAEAEADLEAARDEHRETLADRLDAEAAEAQRESLTAVRKLAECEAKRAAILAVRRWVDGSPYNPAKSASPTLDLRGLSGDRIRLAEAVAAIEAVLAVEPEPVAEVAA